MEPCDDPNFITLSSNVGNPGSRSRESGHLETRVGWGFGWGPSYYPVLDEYMIFRLYCEEAMPWVYIATEFWDLLGVGLLT